jgi:uncharacterized protein (TIGR00255 family)
MIRSMTAFDRKERQGEWGRLAWELRSINHRFLDVYLRLPEDLRQLEPAVRERLSARLGRGKIECGLRFTPAPGVVAGAELNEQVAERLLAACQTLVQRMNAPAPISPLDVLRMPGAMKEAELDLEPVVAAALELLDEAIDGLIESREREGARLAEIVRERAERIGALAHEVRGRRQEINAQLREKLLNRLRELDVAVDPGRVEQEMVIVAQRLDVDEELERLLTHVDEVLRVLKRKEPVGRRLDFLMQELNREANTLSSKSADTASTAAAVEMKVLIEQIREQVQNIE